MEDKKETLVEKFEKLLRIVQHRGEMYAMNVKTPEKMDYDIGKLSSEIKESLWIYEDLNNN